MLHFRRFVVSWFLFTAVLGGPIWIAYGSYIGSSISSGGGGGSGTVTSVGWTTANGFSAAVANSTTTPTITLTAGAITPTSVAPSGLTGSTAASRYCGATASGAPVSGAHIVGDFVIDQTGKVYICTTLGTPGTWTQAGSNPVAGTGIGVSGSTISIDTAVTVDKTTAQTLTNKTISAGTFTNQSNFKTLGYASVNAIGNSGATKTIAWGTDGNVQSITIDQSTTLSFTAPTYPGFLTLVVTNTGAFTVTWPTMKWSGGVVGVVTTGAATDVVTIFYDGSVYRAAISIPDAR